MSEISLNGGEISILKTIGLGGGLTAGTQLAQRTEEMETTEFIETLEGLMSMHYVLANKVTIRTLDDVKSASFHVNPAFARMLRDAVYPSRTPKAETRRRRRA